jgi:hypothetical protein
MASLKSILLLIGLVTYVSVLHYQLTVMWPAEDRVRVFLFFGFSIVWNACPVWTHAVDPRRHTCLYCTTN